MRDCRRTSEWILFSRSTDHGKTWSAPISLSEQSENANPATDYIAYIPCIAVNKAGIIAVTWYDRRGLPGGWHTAGLCADAAGHFHPVWIDGRTGVAQLWSASVAVSAPPTSPATTSDSALP